jgi:hypothetical protein
MDPFGPTSTLTVAAARTATESARPSAKNAVLESVRFIELALPSSTILVLETPKPSFPTSLSRGETKKVTDVLLLTLRPGPRNPS